MFAPTFRAARALLVSASPFATPLRLKKFSTSTIEFVNARLTHVSVSPKVLFCLMLPTITLPRVELSATGGFSTVCLRREYFGMVFSFFSISNTFLVSSICSALPRYSALNSVSKSFNVVNSLASMPSASKSTCPAPRLHKNSSNNASSFNCLLPKNSAFSS